MVEDTVPCLKSVRCTQGAPACPLTSPPPLPAGNHHSIVGPGMTRSRGCHPFLSVWESLS